MDTVIDKWTKEYRDLQRLTGNEVTPTCLLPSDHAPPEIGVVNFEVCNDPHGTGCTIVHPPNDVPRSRTEPCYACIRRNY